MQIIPAIDILRGQVVCARSGARNDYPPLRSHLAKSVAPRAVIDALLDLFPFETVYLADLDAIGRPGSDKNESLIHNLLLEYPQTTFWIDAGVSAAHTFPGYIDSGSCLPVYGTENRLEKSAFEDLRAHFPEMILSLDFTAAGLIGHTDILRKPEHWPATIIVMSLDKVGTGAGPNIALLNRVKHLADGGRIFAAGGIRGKQDMRRLHKNGIHGGLLATALHNGAFHRTDLLDISGW